MDAQYTIREMYKNLLMNRGDLNQEVKGHLFNDINTDMNQLIQFISRTYGSSINGNQLNDVLKNYLNKKLENMQSNMFSNFSTVNPFQINQDPFVSFNQQTNPFMTGQQQSNTFFGNNQNHNRPVSKFFTDTTQKEEKPIIQKEEVVDMSNQWEISDKEEIIVDTISMEVKVRKCTNNGNNVRMLRIEAPPVSCREELIRIALNYVDTKKPYIALVEGNTGVSINVKRTTIHSLLKLYNENGLFGDVHQTNKTLHNMKTAKALIKTLLEFLDSINTKESHQLSNYFIARLNEFISTRLINPNNIKNNYIIEEITDLEEFYSGDVNDELNQYEYYERMRDAIVCYVLRDSINVGMICSFDNPIDRMIMIKSNPKTFYNGYSLAQLCVMNESDKDIPDDIKEIIKGINNNGSFFEEQILSILKFPLSVICTNILPNDMAYKIGTRKNFSPYVFSNVNNIIEDVVCRYYNFKNSMGLYIYPDKYNCVDLSVESIVDGSFMVNLSENY